MNILGYSRVDLSPEPLAPCPRLGVPTVVSHPCSSLIGLRGLFSIYALIFISFSLIKFVFLSDSMILCSFSLVFSYILMTSSISWLCFSVFLAFIILTITASMMFYLSILISLSSAASFSDLPASAPSFFLCVMAGVKVTLTLGC